MTSPEQPPRSPREEEDFLDWSENQAPTRRGLRRVDLPVFLLLLLVTALLIIAVVGFLRGGHA